MYVQAEAEKARLLGVMRTFQESISKRTKTDVDVMKYQTWEEVVSIMERVSEECNKGSGKRVAVRKFFDRLGTNGPIFSAWLGLLPTGEYSSIVCGAFKLVIKVCPKIPSHAWLESNISKAAIHVKAIREIIFETLGSIPAMLGNAKLYVEMWKSLKLHIEFSKLYTAILEVFCHILKWLQENSFKAAAKAFLQQDGYEKSLSSKLKIVENCAAAVREEASICSQYALGSINRNMGRRK